VINICILGERLRELCRESEVCVENHVLSFYSPLILSAVVLYLTGVYVWKRVWDTRSARHEQTSYVANRQPCIEYPIKHTRLICDESRCQI
jgi:hypothetical protein